MTTSTLTLAKAFGPLWKYLNSKDTYELFVDSFDDVYLEKGGEIIPVKGVFKKQSELEKTVQQILKFSKAKIEKEKAIYEINLDKNMSMMVCMPPVAKNGPSLSISKIPKQTLSWEDMIKFKVVRKEGHELIEKYLKDGRSLILSGSVGSGKTTLANIVVNSIPMPMRVVVLEPYSTLILERKMICRLESADKSNEGVKDLISATRKLRADYVVMNELRASYAADYIDLIREGHSAIAVANGENIFDVVKKLELNVLSSSQGMSLDDVRYIIAQAFQVIVFQKKMDDGHRSITHIAELRYESGKIEFDIVYKQ